MKILFDNVDFKSRSGPNSFASKLSRGFHLAGHEVNDTVTTRDNTNSLHWQPDIQLSFITATQINAPVIQRLDGIYFNSEQDWATLNNPIRATYELARGVVFQSKFNKTLSEKYFGTKELSTIVHNGTDLDAIAKISPIDNPKLNKHRKIYMCASSWRPHKRLSENIRYFLEHANDEDCLVVAGQNPDFALKHDRIYYVGNLDWESLVSLYKVADVFIHLALMDHCPNVVVDARASGCHIVCSDSGGTKEIAGSDATIMEDISWDFKPFKLYQPPKLDFTKIKANSHDNSIDIHDVTKKYFDFFESTLTGGS